MSPSASSVAELRPPVRRYLLLASAVLSTACFDSPTSPDSPSSTTPPLSQLESFASTCPDGVASVTGVLPDGALFELCVPATPLGLLLYAHGYTQAGSPLAIQDEFVPTGDGGVQRVSEIVTSLGLAFGATSYPHTGLNGPEAVASLSLLKQAFTGAVGPLPPGAQTYVSGVSEGGMVAALAAEEPAGDFQGVLAACGPVGDFRAQLDYFGDFRVLFDYFFPRVLGPAWTDGPDYGARARAAVAERWSYYQAQVLAALEARPLATAQLIATSRAPVDPFDPSSIGETVIGVLWYNIFATDDARARLGGRPFDNHTRHYTGSFDDARLNARIKRFTADPSALARIASEFQTTGQLQIPVVTDHTLLDPIVKATQELRYAAKVALAGQSARLSQLAVPRYGHCAFTVPELQLALAVLVQKTSGVMLALAKPEAMAAPRFGAFAALGSPETP
jgi:hypothetical protein